MNESPIALTAARLVSDAATEQLYDELLARLAAIGELVPPLRTAIGQVVASDDLEDIATRAVASVRSDDPAAAARLIQELWPTNTAPPEGHPWWSTPLGTTLGCASACAPSSIHQPGA